MSGGGQWTWLGRGFLWTEGAGTWLTRVLRTSLLLTPPSPRRSQGIATRLPSLSLLSRTSRLVSRRGRSCRHRSVREGVWVGSRGVEALARLRKEAGDEVVSGGGLRCCGGAKRQACQEWDSNPRLQGRLRPERSALDRSAILTAGLGARPLASQATERRPRARQRT